MTEIDPNACYEFEVSESTSPNYKCTQSIVEWLKTNLEGLKDDKENKIFSKVNHGYNEETLKSFGKKPVCDVYIDRIDYSSDFTDNHPGSVTSFIICYLKGNMNNTYLKTCELADYLIQEFAENDNFRELIITTTVEDIPTQEYIVKNTFIRDVRFEIIPNGKSYGVLCAFELEHILY